MPQNYFGVVDVKFDSVQMKQIHDAVESAKQDMRVRVAYVGSIAFIAGGLIGWLVAYTQIGGG